MYIYIFEQQHKEYIMRDTRKSYPNRNVTNVNWFTSSLRNKILQLIFYMLEQNTEVFTPRHPNYFVCFMHRIYFIFNSIVFPT